jgi:hypothetical protein
LLLLFTLMGQKPELIHFSMLSAAHIYISSSQG